MNQGGPRNSQEAATGKMRRNDMVEKKNIHLFVLDKLMLMPAILRYLSVKIFSPRNF